MHLIYKVFISKDFCDISHDIKFVILHFSLPFFTNGGTELWTKRPYSTVFTINCFCFLLFLKSFNTVCCFCLVNLKSYIGYLLLTIFHWKKKNVFLTNLNNCYSWKKISYNCIFIKFDTDKFSLHKCIVYILVKSICIKTRSKFISEEYIFNFISQFLALKYFPRWNYGFIASFKYTIETNLILSTIFFFSFLPVTT